MAGSSYTFGFQNILGKTFWDKTRLTAPVPKISFAPPQSDDGATIVSEAGYYGTYLDLDGASRNESTLIERYRDIAQYTDCENAIDDIVTEAIVSTDTDVPVTINTDELDLPKTIRAKIDDEFKNICRLLDFNHRGHDIFRRWYIDGRLYYHKLVDEKHPKMGIQELRYLDPRKTKKIRTVDQKLDVTGNVMYETKQEFYVYSDNGTTSTTSSSTRSLSQTLTPTALQISPESITCVTSGILDLDKNLVLGYLHKCIRPVNHLRMMEDALVIQRVSRAPDRRIFYVDVSGMNKIKAESYLKDLMNRYRNKVVYDACLDMNTRIPLLDGRTLPLWEIQQEFESGKQLWVYSCDPVTGKFAPGLVSSAGVTKFDQKVMRITLDNGKTVTCTYDHKFPVWNKGKVEAKDLVVGDSMIPFYTKEETIHGASKNSTYQKIFENESKKWVFTHREVSKWKDSVGVDNTWSYSLDNNHVDKNTVHHKNYNRYDNTPDNLTKMNVIDHFKYHTQHNSLAGKIGGKVTAQRKRELGVPYFNMTHEQRVANGVVTGAILGKRMVDEKKGIHGLTKEQTQANSRKGSVILGELLKTDPDFNAKYSLAISNGWGIEQRNAASVRAKNRPASHYEKMRKGNAVATSLVFPETMVSLIKKLSEAGISAKDIVTTINSSDAYVEWNKVNNDKDIPNRKKDSLFLHAHLVKVVNIFGFSTWLEYRNSIKHKNHKIVSIEYLEETMDVGTLGIDKDEIYHDYHTFALESGIYTCNSTGEIKDTKKHMSLTEDYWMPRTNTGKGTEIATLPGLSSTGSLDDIDFFQKKLYNSLNVPVSRMEPGGGSFGFGRVAEISRDELKFAKFIDRLRKRFSELFNDLLRTQLVLKGIISPEDWDVIKYDIHYKFLNDSSMSEVRKIEDLRNKVELVGEMQSSGYIGKYMSEKKVMMDILNMTEDEMNEELAQIMQETEINIQKQAQEMQLQAKLGMLPQQ